MDDAVGTRTRPDGREHGNHWFAEATVRTAGRIDAGTIAALARAGAVARCSGAQGISLRLDVAADSCAAAYGSALALLATGILPLLDAADLTDLRIVPGPARPGHRSDGADRSPAA